MVGQDGAPVRLPVQAVYPYLEVEQSPDQLLFLVVAGSLHEPSLSDADRGAARPALRTLDAGLLDPPAAAP
jgi:hypothetical protein